VKKGNAAPQAKRKGGPGPTKAPSERTNRSSSGKKDALPRWPIEKKKGKKERDQLVEGHKKRVCSMVNVEGMVCAHNA